MNVKWVSSLLMSTQFSWVLKTVAISMHFIGQPLPDCCMVWMSHNTWKCINNQLQILQKLQDFVKSIKVMPEYFVNLLTKKALTEWDQSPEECQIPKDDSTIRTSRKDEMSIEGKTEVLE